MKPRMCSQMQTVVLAMSLLVLVSMVRTAPRSDFLTDLLQNEAERKEDLSRRLLMKFLSELEIPDENDSLSDDHVELKRVLRHLALSPRERKAGCRNFFWKTFTSC